jgi:hypothetical protein
LYVKQKEAQYIGFAFPLPSYHPILNLNLRQIQEIIKGTEISRKKLSDVKIITSFLSWMISCGSEEIFGAIILSAFAEDHGLARG